MKFETLRNEIIVIMLMSVASSLVLQPKRPQETIFSKKHILKPIAREFFSESLGRPIDEKMSTGEFMSLFKEIYSVRKDDPYSSKSFNGMPMRRLPIEYMKRLWEELLFLVKRDYDRRVEREGYSEERQEYLWNIRESILNFTPFIPTREQMKTGLFNPWCFNHIQCSNFLSIFFL